MLVQMIVGIPLEMVHGSLRIGAIYMAGVLAGKIEREREREKWREKIYI